MDIFLQVILAFILMTDVFVTLGAIKWYGLGKKSKILNFKTTTFLTTFYVALAVLV